MGDKVYGHKRCAFKLNGQLLHAYKLTFIHPTSNEEVTFTCDLPDYFKDVLAQLKEV